MHSGTVRNELKAFQSICFPLFKAEDKLVYETLVRLTVFCGAQ